MKIGKKLKLLRENKNMTLEELSNALNKFVPGESKITYNKGKLSKWERDVEVPTLYALKYVADYFGVTIDEMIKSETVEEKNKKPIMHEVIAAHFDGDMTDEDINEINQFIEFIKTKK